MSPKSLVTVALVLSLTLVALRLRPTAVHEEAKPPPAPEVPASSANRGSNHVPHPRVPHDSSGAKAPGQLRELYPDIGPELPDWQEWNRTQEHITIALDPASPLRFQKASVREDGAAVSWVGALPDIPGASLITIASDRGTYDALLILPGTVQFSVHTTAAGTSSVSIADPGAEGCGTNSPQPDRPVGSNQSVHALFTSFAAARASNGTGLKTVNQQLAPQDIYASAEDYLWVDVLFLYDEDTLAAASKDNNDPVAAIEGRSRAYIEAGNVVLNNSGVQNFRWRFGGAVQCPAFPHTRKLSDFLTAMAPTGAISSWLTDLRRQHASDQVMFWYGNRESDYSGQAYSNTQAAIQRDFALSASRWDTSYKTVIHELAHNFGCQHDRENVPGAQEGDQLYCYGLRWSLTIPPPLGGPTLVGTIMSYSRAVLPYYSNPELTVHATSRLADYPDYGSPYDWGMLPLGYPIGHEKAAFNSKVLRDVASTMSEISQEYYPPTITKQPVDAEATAGSSVTLSITAEGARVRYRWFRNNDALYVSTPSYTIDALSENSAGRYKALAWNDAGNTWSNEVTVKLTVPAPPPVGGGTGSGNSPGSSAGGGGGGGGAPSLWFLALLAVGWTARFGKSKQRRQSHR